MNKSVLAIISLVLTAIAQSQDTIPGTRNPWHWPFAQNSIWNQPIGSNAEYAPANFNVAGHVDVDIQHIMELSDAYPEQEVLGTEVWGAGRCDGNQNLGFTIHVPGNWIVPDAGDSPYGLTPNSNFAFRLPNSDTVFEGSQVSRCIEGGPVYMPIWMQYPENRKHQTITGNGLEGGGQGASGMSALGGTIRLGELIGNDPIRHAIKINPWAAKYCYYHDTLPGYKWPAQSADNYAKDQYQGTDPNVVMGSLFAIPPGVSSGSLEITTMPAQKLFYTMQNYGVYFTEDAAWDTWDLIVERDVEIEFENTYGFSMSSDIWKNEMNNLIKALWVVTNNFPGNIGGGGVPMAPIAPAFGGATLDKQNIEDNIIKVYPNPLTGNTLYFSERANASIYNLQGTLLQRYTNIRSIKHALKPGVYILTVSVKNHTFSKKLIIL